MRTVGNKTSTELCCVFVSPEGENERIKSILSRDPDSHILLGYQLKRLVTASPGLQDEESFIMRAKFAW